MIASTIGSFRRLRRSVISSRDKRHIIAAISPERFRRYERALARDSSFALAAMHLALAADQLNDAEQHDRALAIAWAHRLDLNERDLTHLVAFAGPRYPAPSLESEQIAAWERAVIASPDRADVWYELGERLFRRRRRRRYSECSCRARVAF